MKIMNRVLWPCVLALALLGCEGSDDGSSNPTTQTGNGTPEETVETPTNNPHVYVAMGDSITLGVNQPYPSWPARLEEMIGGNVVNEAEIGESAGAAAARMGAVLASRQPDYVLIMHGINEMRDGNTAAGVAGVRSMVQQAKAAQVIPVVATYYMMAGDDIGLNPDIRVLDQQLRAMADAEDVALVDVEEAFGEDDVDLLDMPEGFHPSDAGTRLIAQLFADVLGD